MKSLVFMLILQKLYQLQKQISEPPVARLELKMYKLDYLPILHAYPLSREQN